MDCIAPNKVTRFSAKTNKRINDAAKNICILGKSVFNYTIGLSTPSGEQANLNIQVEKDGDFDKAFADAVRAAPGYKTAGLSDEEIISEFEQALPLLVNEGRNRFATWNSGYGAKNFELMKDIDDAIRALQKTDREHGGYIVDDAPAQELHVRSGEDASVCPLRPDFPGAAFHTHPDFLFSVIPSNDDIVDFMQCSNVRSDLLYTKNGRVFAKKNKVESAVIASEVLDEVVNAIADEMGVDLGLSEGKLAFPKEEKESMPILECRAMQLWDNYFKVLKDLLDIDVTFKSHGDTITLQRSRIKGE